MAVDSYDPTNTNLPRGIRNNNPGNIKDDGTKWQGLTGSDGTFFIFKDMGWGTRALATALVNMIGKGEDTITSLISAWAPSSENDTIAYINSVSRDTGIDPGTQLGTDADTLSSLMRAIINRENGSSVSAQYISDEDIQTGLSLMNNPVLSIAQAGLVYFQVDPITALAWLATGSMAIYFFTKPLFSRKKRRS